MNTHRCKSPAKRPSLQAALILCVAAASSAIAQQVTVSLSSGNAAPGGSTTLNISLSTSGGAQPAAVQWTMSYPVSDVASVSVATGASASAASKSVSCSSSNGSTICVAYGMNANVIGNSVLATTTFNIATGAPDATAAVQLTGLATSDPTGGAISTTGSGGTISITQAVTPTLSGLSCNPASVTGPGSAACTVTLSAPAPTGGFTAALASNNTAVTVPANVTVPAGSSSVGFTATVASVSTTQTATLTASASGVSITFLLTATPATLQTWSISGNVSSTGAGATVTLSGAASATVTADATGNYNFTGLANGAYIVTPSKSGFTFTPANQAATINNANQTTINFTAQGQTWSISGTISPSANGSGATMNLSGAATATVTADSSGNYTFSGLANGAYTITPGKNGFTFTPASQSVTVSGANLPGINFSSSQNATGSLTVDVTVWQDQHTPSSTVVSPAFSTISGKELLLAFIGTDYASGPNTTVTNVSGAGLTWVLAARTNVQSGTSEIWRAFAANPLSNVSVTVTLSQSVASSMTVMSFTGVDASGTNGSGAIGAIGSGNAGFGGPTATLVTTRNNSWVFGVGNDFTNAIARTPASGQTLVHQDLPNISGVAMDTFWVQRQNSPTPLSGTSVIINDTSPTSDEYNLSTVEILPALSASTQTLSISGPVSPSAIRNSQAVGLGAIQAASLALSNTATGIAGDACTPGGFATIFGTGFTAGTAQQATSLPLPQQLGGVLVKLNGIAEPLLFVSDSQINFQCPQLPAGSPLHIVVQGESGALSIDSVMRIAAPGLFTVDSTSQGAVLIGETNEIAMPKTARFPSRPVQHGEYITIYATGLGEVVDGVPAGSPAPMARTVPLKNQIKIVAGGVELDPAFAGLAPGTAGLYQVNAQLPPEIAAGPAVPLFIEVILPDGTLATSNIVTVAIQNGAAQ